MLINHLDSRSTDSVTRLLTQFSLVICDSFKYSLKTSSFSCDPWRAAANALAPASEILFQAAKGETGEGHGGTQPPTASAKDKGEAPRRRHRQREIMCHTILPWGQSWTHNTQRRVKLTQTLRVIRISLPQTHTLNDSTTITRTITQSLPDQSSSVSIILTQVKFLQL